MKREYQIRSDGYGYTAQVREQVQRRPEWSVWRDFDRNEFGGVVKHTPEGEARAACDAHEIALRRREAPVTYTPYTPKVSL
jgi:hypothetical protein